MAVLALGLSWLPISIYLRNSVAWGVFLSVYAIIVAHLIVAPGAEAVAALISPQYS